MEKRVRRLSFMEHEIDQVSVIVEDLDESMHKYHEWLGIGPWRVYRYGKPVMTPFPSQPLVHLMEALASD